MLILNLQQYIVSPQTDCFHFGERDAFTCTGILISRYFWYFHFMSLGIQSWETIFVNPSKNSGGVDNPNGISK